MSLLEHVFGRAEARLGELAAKLEEGFRLQERQGAVCLDDEATAGPNHLAAGDPPRIQRAAAWGRPEAEAVVSLADALINAFRQLAESFEPDVEEALVVEMYSGERPLQGDDQVRVADRLRDRAKAIIEALKDRRAKEIIRLCPAGDYVVEHINLHEDCGGLVPPQQPHAAQSYCHFKGEQAAQLEALDRLIGRDGRSSGDRARDELIDLIERDVLLKNRACPLPCELGGLVQGNGPEPPGSLFHQDRLNREQGGLGYA
ncbi:MAG TPA: hypothetical protein VE093_03515 [Polyangiaceae bacterium]|nr:hypothetical protein [Polyangiaceae bacterium]